MSRTFQAIIWDFGGVFTSSPFEAFNRYEAEQGLPPDFIRTVNALNPLDNAWAKLERSDVDAAQFDTLFRAESLALGREVPGRDVLGLLSGSLRPRVVDALKVCKGHGKVGCITNNAPIGKGASMTSDDAKARELAAVFDLFDHLIESSKLGIRKPDPRIYALMCEALDVDPGACVYLDDLGINLKPARDMGMATIKVTSEAQLLADLEAVTGYALS
ncbi:MAG: HAD-IA family hydrolase [Hyphomonas sp.]|uniref:HAD-IA family hydrolase n=1 Tax=Hyphomonas sp. TaxID=87 RepID=UPI0017EB38B3|nr:HAD-IA family hydrolase [Hyphomonas sp.]MBU3921932.1 HAD-IA family hydrolase [Alphaproteobacteria bacterium]MBA3069285.1 HAD-IA family hydrolase [Hyphomonas sp.]MBU4063666.1 HAD-IA family hydrolase [Alphaproteobacteria bacterium]MBU4164373.1 HAD-IA family hydrolase [Alphaproteobacteria bacterium]MBU4568289.1 HAD-IA family hydrolase [Alphaproteobacteria bacterium]